MTLGKAANLSNSLSIEPWVVSLVVHVASSDVKNDIFVVHSLLPVDIVESSESIRRINS